MNEILCPHCGKSNPPEVEFCGNCLSPFNLEGPSKPPSEPEPEIKPESKSETPSEPGSENSSPDWLQRVRERSQAELPETPPLGEFGDAEKRPFDQPIAPGEIPDWLKEIQNAEPPRKAETHEPDSDWVARLHEFQESTNQSPSQSTTFYSDDELAALAAAAKKQESSKQYLPEQVKDKNRNDYEESWHQAVEEPANTDSPESAKSSSQFEGTNQSEPDQPIVENFDSHDEETPDWLKNSAPLEQSAIQPVPVESTEAEFLPEMQSDIHTEKPSESLPQVSEVAQPESDIPVVVKKKSVLSSFFESEEKEVPTESINEPVEPLIPEDVLQPQNSRPVEYSGRLEISESQRDSISLLKKMLVGEIQSQNPVSGHGKISSRYIRAILGVLLLVVMGYPFFTGYLLVKPQALFSPGVVAMHNTISNLPENAHFLIVTDFEPAFSGEMKASATGVIDSLMMKGMNFTIVSTVPSGPALARNLLSNARSGSFTYQPEKIAVLGFLPGGTTGLRDFIRNPRLAAPLLDSGAYAWTYPAAQAVNVIQDYAGVLVITENAETGRAWVEQLHGYLIDQPLLMVVSAQSAPIMRPYLDSKQLDGLIGGRVEGAMYDRLMDAPPRAAIEMSSYMLGMLFATGLIILGGLFGILRKVFIRHSEGSSEEWHAG